MAKLRLVLAQLNPTVGAVAGNAELLRAARAEAADADAVIAGELFLSGYPPEDLVLKPAFIAQVAEAAGALTAETADGGAALIFGAPTAQGDALYNSVIVAEGGKAEIRHKHHLPNYAVFDEKRLFAAGDLPAPVMLRGVPVGVPICEDIWFPDVAAHLRQAGAEMLIVPNGSPFERGKSDARLARARARVDEAGVPLIYVNQVGGQDELIFDGGNFVLNADGECAVSAPFWTPHLAATDWEASESGWVCAPHEAAPAPDELEQIYMAAVVGLRDYVEKNRFPGVLLGLSGGIDSALVAAIAADALGAARVRAVMLPSQYTSAESLEDAAACAAALGIALDEVGIAEPVAAAEAALAHLFAGKPPDITEENIQARMRGTLLMAMSNKFGLMLVTTGNKSEVSVGYATLYGDMNGGYNPVKDIYKTEIFALARWRNIHAPAGATGGQVIPKRIIDKPPSAELRPDQTDQDSLPPYETLDAILFALIEEESGVEEIIARGHDADLVRRVEHLLYVSEYKRRQAAPGAKIGRRHFGRDRRYPITNGFRDA